MTGAAYDLIVGKLQADGRQVKETGDGRAQAQCPAHDDNRPSLSIAPRKDGKGIVIHCQATCDYTAVLDALGLHARDLWDDDHMRAIYSPVRDYRYSGGLAVHRKADKSFPQSGNKKDESLFQVERIGEATTVYFCEGEKDAETVEAMGGTAVSASKGAGNAHKADLSPLLGRHIIIVRDRDKAGDKHVAQLVTLLDGIAASVAIVEAKAGKDPADHVANGFGLDELVPVELDTGPGHVDDESAGDVGRSVFPAPTAPLDVARKLYDDHYRDAADLPTMIAWRGGRMRWCGQHWTELDDAEIRSHVYDQLGAADYMAPIKVKGEVVGEEPTPWNPNKHRVADVLEAMAAVGHVSSAIDPPSWLHSAVHAETTAAQVISCTNGLLDRATRNIQPHTPALFNVVSVPFAYDQDAPEPTAWIEFLASVWPDDRASIELLQEFMGYVLSGRTDMQKLLMLVGPIRSGKGTIARLLTDLIGRGHVAGPTLASMGTNFGLSPLLGKPLAIISDARLGDAPVHTVVERLLSITGEDLMTVDRKYREPWTGKLPSRFVILSNELPRFRDASGAIATRMLILQMTNSFLGREDRTLDDRLHVELPGILNWSLDGLDRLTEKGRFTVPTSSQDATNLMADLASPVSAFVRDMCDRGPQETVLVETLYSAWKTWAEDQGHVAGAKNTFGQKLLAVAPEIKITQPTIDGRRVRLYAYIALKPVQPVHWTVSAGQSDIGGKSQPVHDADHPVQSSAPERACTGCGTEPDGDNPLVNGLCTGCTGKSALRAPEEKGARCNVCRTELLLHPTSIERGYCQACAISKVGVIQ